MVFHRLVIWLCCAWVCVASLPVLPLPASLQVVIPSTMSSFETEMFFLPDHATWPVIRGHVHIEYNFSAAQASSLANADFTFDVALAFNISIPSFRIAYQKFPLQTRLHMSKCHWNGEVNIFSERNSPLFISASTLLSAVAVMLHTDKFLLGPVYVHSCIVSAILTGPDTIFSLLKYTFNIHAGADELGNLWSPNPYTSVGKLDATLLYSRPLIVRAPAAMVQGSPLCIYAQWQRQAGNVSSGRLLASRYFADDLLNDDHIMNTYSSTVSNNGSSEELWIRIAYGSGEQYFLLRMLPPVLLPESMRESTRYDEGGADGEGSVSIQFTSGACRLIPGGTGPGPDPTPTPIPPNPTQPDEMLLTAWQMSLCIVGCFISSMFLVLVAVIWQRQRQQWSHGEHCLVGSSAAAQPLLSLGAPVDSSDISYTSPEQVHQDHEDGCR
eukprot:GILK01012363.1.p1 GENE.GILK01012363.1~~GILK01012363.1.p1  ORF type:complete len:440 (-),score=39.13 GILK01012363.1:385-1704(-)